MILSDFPMFGGSKWFKYSTNKTTETVYRESANISGSLYQQRESDTTYACDTGYAFSSDRGYYSTGHINCKGSAMSGYYVSPTSVHSWGSPTGTHTDSKGTQYTEYLLQKVASASSTTTTTYSKGGTYYGFVYAEDGELPEEGTLVAGSASGSYCIINVGGTVYYYEKST